MVNIFYFLPAALNMHGVQSVQSGVIQAQDPSVDAWKNKAHTNQHSQQKIKKQTKKNKAQSVRTILAEGKKSWKRANHTKKTIVKT